MRLRFLTSTPLSVTGGSGTFMGISTLARFLELSGITVEMRAPGYRLPVFTAQRLLFNEELRWSSGTPGDADVGFDMDGYRLAPLRRAPHVASIKGVIADERLFERGFTRATMSIQARCERAHVHAADLVVTTSRYAAARIAELYGLPKEPDVVPELIDLEGWRAALRATAPDPAAGFRVLCVCRFYPRKRVQDLLWAAARLKGEIAGFELRIVGGGPEEQRLRALAASLGLGPAAVFLGSVSREALAAEYRNASVFCMPSVQEGFGIVFLEAMAAGVPIAAYRAAAIPEVAPHALLTAPKEVKGLADSILTYFRDPSLRERGAAQGLEIVRRYDAAVVAADFAALLRNRLGICP